jgi:hypothetical protein
MLFLKEDYNRDWSERINEKKQNLSKGFKGHRTRNSTDSTRSSVATRPSSDRSNTRCPPTLAVRAVASNSSMETSHSPVNVRTEVIHNPFSSESLTQSLRETQIPRPQSKSPDLQVTSAPTEIVQLHFPPWSGPMDRFLNQDDELQGSREDPERLKEWSRLRSLRTNVLRLRSQLRIKRAELHEKQLAKSTADEAFIRYVREHRPVSSPNQTLDAYYTAMQTARDEYGPLEYDYNQFEDILDETEFEMAKIEGRLYNSRVTTSLETPSFDQPLQDSGNNIPGTPSSFLGLSSDIQDEYHPLHVEYLSRLGDLDLAKERYHNMKHERQSLISERESRSRIGLQLQGELQVFLNELPAHEAEVQREIAEIETDVLRLRSECLAVGIDLNDNDDSSGSSGADGEDDSMNITTDNEKVPAQKQSPPSQNRWPESLILQFDPNNKSDRINRWLLFNLRTTPLEVALLLRTFLQFMQILDIRQWRIDGSQWQDKVLFFWDKDQANKSAEAFKLPGARSSAVESHPSTTIGGRAHAMSTTSPTKPPLLTQIPRLSKSAPDSLDLDSMLKGSEIIERLHLD